MTSRKLPVALLTVVTVAMPIGPAVSAPSPLAMSCMACHQPQINSAEMPALSSMAATEIEASLKAARDQPQAGAIMTRFAAKLSDAEIAQLAAELGALPPKPHTSSPKSLAKPVKREHGKP